MSETDKFQEIYCSQCTLCYARYDEDFNPGFCFDVYMKNPEIFNSKVFFRMLSMGEEMDGWDFGERDLEYIFCETGVCFLGDLEIARTCCLQSACAKKFKDQACEMGKKKHKRKNKLYSEKQFKEIICASCNVCAQDHDCDFCYYEMYKHNPEHFAEKFLKRLIAAKKVLKVAKDDFSTITRQEFINYVCNSGLCYDGDLKKCDDCELQSDCYDMFMDQVAGILSYGRHVDLKALSSGKKKKKEKKGYVCAPYATFFSSTKADFEKEIKRILYGNNNSESDKDKEKPAVNTAAIDPGTKDGESKVRGSAKAGT